MRLKSKGLGRKELVMDFREYDVVEEGDEIVVTGTIREPVTWDFSIRMCEDDLVGIARVATRRSMLGLVLRSLGHRHKRDHWVTPPDERPALVRRSTRPGLVADEVPDDVDEIEDIEDIEDIDEIDETELEETGETEAAEATPVYRPSVVARAPVDAARDRNGSGNGTAAGGPAAPGPPAPPPAGSAGHSELGHLRPVIDRTVHTRRGLMARDTDDAAPPAGADRAPND